MDIDPSYAEPVQRSTTDKLNHFLMCHGLGLIDLHIRIQELASTSAIADEQFAKDELVPEDFISLK